MSWGKANIPTKSPKTAGVDGNDLSTNEQAVPVRWLSGLEWCPLTWIVDKVYNQRTEEIRQKAGKGKETTTGYRYYGDVAGIACLGLADRILAFESGNEVVWTGSVSRPDNEAHPDYWRTVITTPVAKMGFYWGRANQPVDDLLLAGIGAVDPTLAHPAYRHQCLVILQNYFFGENSETVPNSRVLVWRAPRPALGNFAPQFAEGGESMVAAILELATNPIFGAGVPLKHFQAGEWEAMSAEVLAAIGGLSPSLDRAIPLRDAVKDLQSYYDGWTRFENGRLKPGRFPHDGNVPGGLTELSVHDFIDHPDVRAGTPSSTVNDVRVIYRDRNDLLKRKPASSSASANVKARKGHEPRMLEMPAFITPDQAARFAAEAAVTGAEGEWGGEGLRVRAPRAKWAGGARLQAGDNFNLDLIAPQVDQVSRITRRVDFFRTPPTLDFIAERGVYPTPYVPPADLRPDIGKVVPLEITQARVLELTPDLAGTPLGLPVAFLAKRPKSEFEGASIAAANVIGFNVWYGGATGASYDTIGHMPGWGVRGTLREALANDAGDVVVKMAMDADNLDLGRLAAQSAQGQLNDNLLIVVGDELFSVGAITIAGLNYDLSCKRVRLGSLPAAHALGAEAWVVWRDELRVFIHKGFVEDQDRYFKLQPYTSTTARELADCAPLLHHFRDRAPEAPVIVINPPGGELRTGMPYTITGQISDVNGDLTTYEIAATRYTGAGGALDAEFTLKGAEVPPDQRALFTFKVPFMFPLPGTWRIRVKAFDATGAFTTAQTAELTVAQSATVDDLQVLIDAVEAQMAALTLEAQQLADDLLAEVAARGQAIIDEATAREDADASITTALNAVTADYNDNKATVAGQISAITTVNSAQATSITALQADMGTAQAQISSVSTALTDETNTRASQVTSLQSQVNGIDSQVDILAAAYIVGGQAIATWGFKLDANGKVVGMQAIAASGGSQADAGVIVFSGADLQSDNFDSGEAGWRIRANGDVELNQATFRGYIVAEAGQGGPDEGGQVFLEMPTSIGGHWAMDVYSNGNLRFFIENNPGIAGTKDIEFGGDVYADDFIVSSSRELKANIRALDSGVLDRLLSVQGVKFEWSDPVKLQRMGQTDIGVIAEDVERAFPELVGFDSRGVRGVSYHKLVPVLIEAIRELRTDLDAVRNSSSNPKTKPNNP